MSNKPENIYDSNEFFDNYIDLRNNKNSISANEIIEMPAIYNELPDLKGKKVIIKIRYKFTLYYCICKKTVIKCII